MTKRLTVTLICILIIFSTFSVFYKIKKKPEKALSRSENKIITTELEWQEGISTNIRFDDPSGTIELDNAALEGLTATGAGDASYNGMYVKSGTNDGKNTYTNGSRWLWFWGSQNGWMLSEAVGTGGLGAGTDDYAGHNAGYFLLPNPTSPSGTYSCNPPPYDDQKPPPILRIAARHTTAATQIDGGENFWSWEGFTPSQTVPELTSITYRYRTSINGSDWTGWVSDIGSVTSRAGDAENPTRYRYLQVEATLEVSDVVMGQLPKIDEYHIDYHTEVKPSAPSAQTAVVQ